MAQGFTTAGYIRFEPVKHGYPGDYDAEAGGIRFSIVKSTDAGFGISATKGGKGIANRLGSISWQRTRTKCAAYADLLLRTHGEALTVGQHAAKLAFLGNSLPLTPGFHDFLEANGLMGELQEKH